MAATTKFIQIKNIKKKIKNVGLFKTYRFIDENIHIYIFISL